LLNVICCRTGKER